MYNACTVFHAKRVEFENRDKKSKSQAKHLHPTSRYLFEITGLLSDLVVLMNPTSHTSGHEPLSNYPIKTKNWKF